ncbi:UDP-phosphate galactose phosphotransferase [Selenomonas sp. oral taxon 126]|uniref:undecaprenyl-phosphate galactose phosphotransferase WbaP n=1 Tax=Selenomonas sp. oral taxon 126 TaxID=712528 RepID=UPI00080772A2|nr:undecaprenyl-phosphate galactose phosphotransferase WbaP [Selenomonas sp. oral taxon 126]ANR69695.1 UDP-phosphate galactose phosphotransferase [Selenomonas sp. oral taxon 126]
MQTRTRIPARIRRICIPLLFIFFDYFAILLAEKMAFGLHDLYGIFMGTSYHVPDAYLFFWIPLVFIAFLAITQTYTRMQPILETVRQIFYAVLYALITCILALYFMQASMLASRLYVILFGVLALFNIYVVRYVILKILKSTNTLMKPVILIGAGKTAELVLRSFDQDLGYRYKVVGILDDDPLSESLPQRFLLMGTLENAPRIIRDSAVHTVIVTVPGMEKEKLQTLLEDIQPYVRDIVFVPDLIGVPLYNVEAQTLFNEQIMMLSLRNNLARRRNRVFKRLFDIIVGGLLCVPILPVLFVIAVWIKLDSQGNAFFNAERIGKRGKIFTCYKFRSMYLNSGEILEEYLVANPAAREEWNTFAKLRDYDPRVTKVGRWIRKYSLDELPQILNVIKGDMSLVGPRPYLPREKKDIGEYLSTITLTVPGITGFWQTSGRNDVSFAGRVAMDTWYVRNWSIWLDLMYLFKTIKIVFTGKGAY